MIEKDRKLLNSLYQFYTSGNGVTGKPTEGDAVIYDKADSKHSGKNGIFQGIRKEDGKYKLKFDNSVFYASPKYVKKLDTSPHLDKLYRILDQMVLDGDLKQASVDQFKKEVDFKFKKITLDPYDEENWDEEKDSILDKPVKSTIKHTSDQDFRDFRGC